MEGVKIVAVCLSVLTETIPHHPQEAYLDGFFFLLPHSFFLSFFPNPPSL